ncbi:MAG: hypothetical protein JNM72_16705 [Deltaproteobacteria bacterium]|nr:hypothetical protein [Deltaproteobacteria bacterium]
MPRSPLLLLPLVLFGCAGKEPGSITVPLQWAAAPTEGTLRPAGRTVEVSLQEGSVSFADLRLHAPAAAARRWGPADLLVGRAHAHPGHDPAGDVRLEALGAWTEDLRAASDGASLGALSGREGEVATASLRLHAGAPQTLVGVLTEGGQQLPFALSVTIDDPIEGVEATALLQAEAPPTAVRLGLDPQAALLPLLESGPLAGLDTDGDGALTAADAGAENSLRFGLLSTLSWTIEVLEAGADTEATDSAPSGG